ncbi:MAG: cytochrome c [Gemmatimonadota bacterium]|nr:cytochrome c [Gemmatimonadota bacterium]
MRLVTAIVLGVLVVAGRSRAVAQTEGETAYRKECKSCHGLKGVPPARARGQYKKIKAVGEDGFVTSLTVDSIITILRNGIDKDMKSFKSKLSEDQMRAAAEYILTLAKQEGG